jgi:hypothetical protein
MTNYTELLERLGMDIEWAQANEWEAPICLQDDLQAAAVAIGALVAELEQARTDRDAARELVRGDCRYCKHHTGCCLDDPCKKCVHFAAKEFIEGDYWEA